MNIRIDKEILNFKLDNVAHAISSKSPLAVLTGVKIEATSKGLELVASNGEISIKTTIDAENIEIIEKGKVLVEGKILVSVVKAISNGTIQLQVVDSVLVVKGGRSEYKINIMDVDSYPNIDFEAFEGMNSLNINSNDFLNIVKKVVISVSASEKKPILTGVNIKGENGKIIFAATDAFRLSLYTLDKETDTNFNIVVPGASLNELLKCSFEEGESTIKFFGNKFIFEIGSLTFMTRLLDGQYPDVSRLIPSEFECSFEFNRFALLNATNRISIMSSDSSTKDKEISHNAIKFTTISKSFVKIVSDSSAFGKASEEVELSNTLDITEPVSFAFASKNLISALNSYESEFVKINYISPFKPFTVTTENEPNLVQLILPIRLS